MSCVSTYCPCRPCRLMQNQGLGFLDFRVKGSRVHRIEALPARRLHGVDGRRAARRARTGHLTASATVEFRHRCQDLKTWFPDALSEMCMAWRSSGDVGGGGGGASDVKRHKGKSELGILAAFCRPWLRWTPKECCRLEAHEGRALAAVTCISETLQPQTLTLSQHLPGDYDSAASAPENSKRVSVLVEVQGLKDGPRT